MIKFTGDYKALIPMGYEFKKLFGRNHICYRIDDVWIWRKGKDVEINDLYQDSYLVLYYLINNGFTIAQQFNMLCVDTIEKTVEPYQFDKHDPTFYSMQKEVKPTQEEMIAFYQRFRKVHVKEETIQRLKVLHEKKMIEIASPISEAPIKETV